MYGLLRPSSVRLESKNSKTMKNFETILNVGQDAANYIQVDHVNEIEVYESESL